MPELPEVETIARYLDGATRGHRVTAAAFYRKDLREPIPTLAFKRVLEGETLVRVFRRSKYLLMESRKGFGLFHLGMSGKLLLRSEATAQFAHTHLIVHLLARTGEASYLHYLDPRRFGRIAVHEGPAWESHPLLLELGREPLEGRELGRYLWRMGAKRRVPIKNFLMDNKVLVGVGNIYACEALFHARLHPAREACTLTLSDYERLAQMVRRTLRAAIRAGGTSFRDYQRASGELGSFARALTVYGRKEEGCRSCQNPIAHLRQAGRSTWYCPSCQI